MTPLNEKMTPIPESSTMNSGGCPKSDKGRLSVVSTMYDLDGKGYLDETEQQLRNLDVENTGRVPNDKVYELMMSQLEAQRKLYKTKKVLFGVCAFAVLLALTTLGTAFAASELAKESSVQERSNNMNHEEELMSKDGTEAIGMHTIGHEIQLEQHNHNEGVADHACLTHLQVAQMWEQIASEFEVHLILLKYDKSVSKDHMLEEQDRIEQQIQQMKNEELIPLTGAKSSANQLCFTSFNDVAACVAWNDSSCTDELDDDEMLTMIFPNSLIVSP